MRAAALTIPLLLLTCTTSPSPAELRADDFGWLSGTWHGRSADGHTVELVFGEPTGAALVGEYVATTSTGTVARSALRLVSDTGNIELLVALDGGRWRTYPIAAADSVSARFRGRSFEYPGEYEFARSGDELRLTIRGDAGLGVVREIDQLLRRQPTSG